MLKKDKSKEIFTGFNDIEGKKIFLNDVLLLPNKPYAYVIMASYDDKKEVFMGKGGMTPNKEDQQVFSSDIFCKCINTRE